jgi:hypothetical protein
LVSQWSAAAVQGWLSSLNLGDDDSARLVTRIFGCFGMFDL